MILSRIEVESNKCSLNYFNIQDSLFQDWHSIDPFAKCQLARVLIDFDAYVSFHQRILYLLLCKFNGILIYVYK